MKIKYLCALTCCALVCGPAAAAVSISLGEPGFYGRLDIGNYPQPELLYSKPLVIQPVRGAAYDPIYLRVPPDQARNWRSYCHRYDACGRPVYFVQDRWYNNVYAPRYRERYREHNRGGDRDEHRGRERGEEHGRERGR